jgi:cobalt-zinc-cadmium efflux system protein
MRNEAHTEAEHQSGAHAEHASNSRGDAWLIFTVVLNVLLTIAQLLAGGLSGSLSLVADALHNLNDAASLGIAVVARRIARRPADEDHTYGHRRAETIAALINLTALVVIGLLLTYEAIVRFFEKQEIDGWIVVIVAAVALVIDLASAILTHVFGGDTLNFKAAMVHKLADAFASLGVIIAGTLILLFEWYVADLIAALAIASYIIWQGVTLMRPAIHVLMESVPEQLELDAVVDAVKSVPGVVSVHQVRLWLMDEDDAAFDAHIVVDASDPGESERVKEAVKRLLHKRFDITHTTLEMERPAHDREADSGPHGKP